MPSYFIIHKKFHEASKFTVDTYWKDLLEKCSCNKFPKGMSYDETKKNLYIRKKNNRSEVLNIPEDPEKLCEFIINIAKEKLNLFSAYDLKIKKEELSFCQKPELDCEWTKLKPKYLKELFIFNYIQEMAEKYDLSFSEKQDLYHQIKLGIEFKKLRSQDFKYKNGRILKIKSIKFDEKNREWKLTRADQKSSNSDKSSRKSKLNYSLNLFVKTQEMRLKNFDML